MTTKAELERRVAEYQIVIDQTLAIVTARIVLLHIPLSSLVAEIESIRAHVAARDALVRQLLETTS